MSNVARNPGRAGAAVEPDNTPGTGRSTKSSSISGTRPASRTGPPARAQLPTLVEESHLLEGERITVVPPLSMEEYARSMTDSVDDDWDTPPAEGPEVAEVHVESMSVSERFDLIAEIAECYLARLGSREAVPYVVVGRRQVAALALDHWSGFVLSLVDGVTPIQDILDVSPMPEHEALDVLDQLRERGVIKVRPRPRRT